MDQQAATLLATLKRTSAASDSKLTLLNNLKSDIKHHRVPDNAHPIIFDCLKYAISQQASSTLATAALTTFSHLIKRLKIQDVDGAAIIAHAPKLLPALQERLGDLRESHRAGAAQVLTELWPFCGHDVEDMVRDEAIAGTNARAKDAGMQWVVKMNHDASLPFKAFVPCMVANLEDSDGNVRDAAKLALVELFKPAPNGAKADLKKQLKIHGVRQGITNQVLSQIESTPGPEVDMTASTRSIPTFDPAAFAESLNSEAARPPPPAEEVPMDPIFVHTQRELEDTFRDMQPFFEGRESEENWVQRDRSVTKLRRLSKGNAPSDYYQVYMAGIKQLQDGILKVANSLRTTTSTNGCQLVQELAKTLGPALDPMVEIYLQSFIKMSAATKNIAAQNGNHTVDTILQYVTCNVRIMQHIWLASQDKNVQPRTFAATWLRTVLSRQSGSKTHFEHTGGLDLAEKTIKKGLNDPQPKVKESMRAAYWTFAKTWPEKATAIMTTLDSKAQMALERDSHNPNVPSAPSNTNTLRAATVSRAQSRASVRDAILAARKNLGKSQNERPVSAMAAPTMSPARSKSSNNLSLRQPSAAASASSRTPSNPVSTSRSNDSVTSANTASNSRTTESTTAAGAAARPGSLMSGAARRPVRKPEPPRAATADPYASRRLLRPETPSTRSPVNSPRQETVASMARAAAASASRKKLETESPVASPGRQYASPRSAIPSPRAAQPSPKTSMPSPRPVDRPRPSSKGSTSSISEEPSLTKEEEFTLVVPSRSRLDSPTATRRRPTIDKTMSVDSGVSAIAEDDNFTMVMPNGQPSQKSQSPNSRRTPVRSVTEDTTHIPHPPNAHSPVVQRARRASDRSDAASQSRAQSVPRQSSPLKTSISAPAEEFQIHEDPFNTRANAPQASSPSLQEPRVLNELPVNESSQPSQPARDSPIQDSGSPNNADDTSKNGALSPSASPESKTEIVRSRKLLISGIERVKSHNLDAHGFRKVLELVRSSESGDVFGSVGEGKRFDDLCAALLEYVVEPLDPTAGNVKHTQELKRQAITVMRTLLNKQNQVYKKWLSSGRWCQRTLAASFDARKGVDGMGLLVKDIETLAFEALTKVHPEEGEKTVLAWLEQAEKDLNPENEEENDGVVEPSHDNKVKSTARATALALRTLSSLLARHGSVPILADISTRIGRMTAACLRSVDAEVRKAAVELATDLHGIWPGTEDVSNDSKNDYWTLLEKSGVQESARNLIVYFIARRARSA